MAAKDILKTVTFSAASASTVGQTIEASSCSFLTLTVVATVTSNDLVGSVQLGSTSDDVRAYDLTSVLPALTNGVAITALPSGITYTGGLLTFATAAVGTHEVSISYPAFGKWLRPRYIFGSGGGDVSLRVTVAVWSV